MKFSLATIALAAAAVASPTNNPPSGGTCSRTGNSDGKVVCCVSAIPVLGQLLCNVLPVGNTCSINQDTYCCDTKVQGGLINLVALNCIKLL